MASSSSQWHSVNPHTRPLSLSILELTPLALTLSLTLAAPPSPSLQPVHSHSHQHVAHTHNHTHGPKHKKKSRHKRHDSDDELTAVEADDEGQPSTHPPPDLSNFKDLLSHGVVVSVNGQPWSRIVAHVSEPEEEAAEGEINDTDAEWEDDEGDLEQEGSGITQRRPRRARFTLSAGRAVDGDESSPRKRPSSGERKEKLKLDKDQAVVVVYGLSPGTEYEIELQVLGLAGPEGDVFASNSVVLPSSSIPPARSRANSLLVRSVPASRSNSMSAPHPGRPIIPDTSSLSPDRAVSNLNGVDASPAPIATNILNPVDTQAAQIRHMIAAAHVEREHLQTQIKEARRASQRAEAALRSEIESVKRAIDKAGSMDLRAKQKALALQEQVKQGWAGAELAEQQAESVKNGLDDLRNRLGNIKVDVDGAEAEYAVAKAAEDEVRERDRKARLEEEKKLAEVVGKIDKLRIKKDKKEAEKAELEARLDELERQREYEERRTVEEKYARRSSAYWWDPHVQNHGGHPHTHPHHHDHHAHRGRGFARHVSHPRSVPPAQPSPTASSFQPNTASPAFVPAAVSGSPAPSNRTPSAAGVNVSATPFKPSEAAQHTALMPPQLQHRIYLPSERPRPAPTFNPPPSVMAEQRQSPSPSSPTFSSTDMGAAAPSLASMVTRAVLSPTSVLSGQAPTPPRPSPPLGSGPMRFNSQPSPVSAGLRNSNPSSPSPYPGTVSNHSSGHSSRQTTFGPPPDRSEQSPTLSSGPWGPQSITGLAQTSTPPAGTFRSGEGRQSPKSPASSGSGRV